MASPSTFADPRSALAQLGKLLESHPRRAASRAREMATSNPDLGPAWLMLGRALRKLGKASDAEQAERKAIAAWTRSPPHLAAAQAIQRGDSMRANQILQQLHEQDPDDALALILFGSQASKADQFQLAEELLGRAVELVPSDPGARLALAELMFRSKRYEKALAELDRIPPVERRGVSYDLLRADCLGELGRLEEQVAILKDISKRIPDPVALNLRLGNALRMLGHKTEAEQAYRDLLAKVPSEGAAWWGLAQLRARRFSDDDLAAMEQALSITNAPPQNHLRIHFTLGRAFEDRKDYDRSFRHYAAGNRIRSEIMPYDPKSTEEWVERSRKTFDKAFFAGRVGWGATATDPIFIIGMQRSGSTLLEQILASHPMIEGTAELPDIPNLVRDFSESAAAKKKSFEAALEAADADAIEQLGKSYLESSALHRKSDRPRFTDKMPNNWMHVGFIHLILPNAKIIDVRRDPMDCCFSNFKQLYARGLNHSFRLDYMGRFYADYVALMRHYDQVLPGLVHRVIYEDLVDDLEGETRKLLDYLGLAFDPACLEFHRSERAVQTISANQVREPINRKGIGVWKQYEPWLDPLKESLGDTRKQWRT